MKDFFLKLMLYIFLVVAASMAGAYILKQPLRDAEKKNLLFDKITWKQFYAQPANSIDILFLGSSHAYRSFNPLLIDSLTHQESFVIGSPAQTPVTSYYILKNVLLTQTPKTIVLENYFFPIFYETDQLDNGGIVYDNIEQSAEKDAFFKNGFNLYEKCALTFFPIIRYKNNYTYVLKKLTGTAKLHTGVRYVDKGFAESDKKVTQHELHSINMFDNYIFDPEKINSKNIQFFKKTIELCKSKKIRVIVFTCPVPYGSYSKIKNPAKLDMYFGDLSEHYDIEYYNFLNPHSCNLDNDSLFFSDYHHLNSNGSFIVSNKIAQIINKKIILL